MTEQSETSEDLNHRIARRVRTLRTARGLSLEDLAAASGVSRSMISVIERAESSPTAVVLDKLATGLGVMLSSLFDADRPAPQPLVRRDEQPQWRDPESGYLRCNLTPPGFDTPLRLVEVSFPPGARVAYESAERDAQVHQQIWVMDGAMQITLGNDRHELATGDCLAMRLDRPIVFSNPHRRAAHYLVAITTLPAIASRRPA